MASSTVDCESSPGNGRLIAVVGPTNAGKTSFVNMLAMAGYGQRGITCTTRPPRIGEKDGKDYYFLTRETFKKRQKEGLFLECAEVHGNLYGTPKAAILESLAAGRDVICAIDIQGLRQIKDCSEELIRYGLFSVFIYASLRTVERRLKARALAQGKPIPADEFETRMNSAKRELECVSECQAMVANDLDGEVHIANAFEALKRAIDLRGRLVSAQKQPRPWHQARWIPRGRAIA